MIIITVIIYYLYYCSAQEPETWIPSVLGSVQTQNIKTLFAHKCLQSMYKTRDHRWLQTEVQGNNETILSKQTIQTVWENGCNISRVNMMAANVMLVLQRVFSGAGEFT